MKHYLVKYQEYEIVFCGYVEAKTERLALIKFIFEDLKHQKKEDGYLSPYYLYADENIKKQIRDILDDKVYKRDNFSVKEITEKKAFIWF